MNTRFRAAALGGSLAMAFTAAVVAEDLIANDDQIARFEICFDFGCKSTRTIYLYDTEWRPVKAALSDSASAEHERERIAVAIAMMEAIVGEVSPTGADRAGNDVPDSNPRGQMDCIDESTNASTYLKLFEEQGLLKWHRVLERVYRAPMVIDEHWAAQIEELGTGARYAIDSWPRGHAVPAVVQKLAQWIADVAPVPAGPSVIATRPKP